MTWVYWCFIGVLLGFIEFYWGFIGFYGVLLGFDLVLRTSGDVVSCFCWVLWCFF